MKLEIRTNKTPVPILKKNRAIMDRKGVVILENKEEIKVSGLLSEEVMKEYLVFHSRKSRIWYVIFGMLLYAVLIRIAIPDIPIIFMLFAMLFAGMIVWFIVPMATKKKAIKEYRSDQLMQQEVFYIVSRDGISQK